MTTKEKQRRKKLAEKQRLNTPAVIVPPVSKNEESKDLMAAAKTPSEALDTETVIDDAPLVGDPITEQVISDQAAADATINTQSAPEPTRSPTNEELATAALEAANAGEFEPDPMEVWFSEKCIAFKNWLSEAPGKLLNAINDGYAKYDAFMHSAADNILAWSYKTNNTFRQRWSQWFPKKATVDQLAEAMNYMAQYVNTGLEEVKQMVASKNTIDRGRLDSLLVAVKSNQKVRATKLYASLTGADLIVAKEAIEALA